jgi:hypothetical protein
MPFVVLHTTCRTNFHFFVPNGLCPADQEIGERVHSPETQPNSNSQGRPDRIGLVALVETVFAAMVFFIFSS